MNSKHFTDSILNIEKIIELNHFVNCFSVYFFNNRFEKVDPAEQSKNNTIISASISVSFKDNNNLILFNKNFNLFSVNDVFHFKNENLDAQNSVDMINIINQEYTIALKKLPYQKLNNIECIILKNKIVCF